MDSVLTTLGWIVGIAVSAVVAYLVWKLDRLYFSPIRDKRAAAARQTALERQAEVNAKAREVAAKAAELLALNGPIVMRFGSIIVHDRADVDGAGLCLKIRGDDVHLSDIVAVDGVVIDGGAERVTVDKKRTTATRVMLMGPLAIADPLKKKSGEVVVSEARTARSQLIVSTIDGNVSGHGTPQAVASARGKLLGMMEKERRRVEALDDEDFVDDEPSE